MFSLSGYRDDYCYKNDRQAEVSVISVRVIFKDWIEVHLNLIRELLKMNFVKNI